MSGLYPWLKVLHIVAVVAWMAGLLYLPRLYVYHAAAPEHGELLATMERRLLRGIMWPALAMTWLFGAGLAAIPGVVDWRSGWIWAKLALVAGLTGFHLLLGYLRRAFAAGRNRHSAGFYRAVNEIPTLVLIAIVILVVVKPF